MIFKPVAIPKPLQAHVEFIYVSEYDGEAALTTNGYLNALPGIIFQHHNGHSPIDHITTSSACLTDAPTLFVYGQMTERNVVNYKKGRFTATQIFLKPYALQSLLGVNAAAMTNQLVDLREFSSADLNMRLLEAKSEPVRLSLLMNFLTAKLNQATMRDHLIEESLRLVHDNVSRVTVKSLHESMNLSERQFEKRFIQTVGLTPQFYIRVKRFNEAVRLMQTRPFEKLTDIAHHLNYYDQSHFVRDIKAFSGLTPKTLFKCYVEKDFSKAGASSLSSA